MGFKNGLRPFIGLDGTFLKGKAKRQLLIVVALDSMNHLYPIARVVVDKETKVTWTWFLTLLNNLLDLKLGGGYTFMSDMHKAVVPDAHHRYYVRHIETNWCRRCGAGDLRKKAYFDTVCKNQQVDNNESLHSWILDVMHKPIIRMLEDIRVKVMNMLREHEGDVMTWTENLSPHTMQLYYQFLNSAQKGIVDSNRQDGYEVNEGTFEKHRVHILLKKCTCRT
ncbi:uncharacterized protein [Nicotiana tomentosiformis]|uniref:uncharacterized protein n=1 Tax=Nicotiana tomentosiformis TaxID=4098 RepID=UPI00388C7379